MISLDYYTTWGEVRSYTLYFPLHRKEGGRELPTTITTTPTTTPGDL